MFFFLECISFKYTFCCYFCNLIARLTFTNCVINIALIIVVLAGQIVALRRARLVRVNHLGL